MSQSECSKVFIALGGSQRLFLPVSVFASKINPESRDFVSRTLSKPCTSVECFPMTNPQSHVSTTVRKKEKNASEGVRGLRSASAPSSHLV